MKIVVAQRLAAALACVGMLVQPAMATSPVAAAPIADVALASGGVFSGKVVNAQGAPLAEKMVSVRQAGQEVASTKTDQQGAFTVEGLNGGLYQVVSEGGVVSYRLWAANTAPPAANQAALIVTGDDIVNGQYCNTCPPNACGCPPGKGAGIMGWVREHPLLVAAGIATAIAVPLAVADDDDPAS